LQFAVETSDAWVEHRIRQVQEDSTTAAQATAAELAQLRERLATREHEIKTLHDRVDSLTSERNHAQRASRWQRILNRVKRKLSWNGRKGHV
jgi:thiamine kinase-like enzyme